MSIITGNDQARADLEPTLQVYAALHLPYVDQVRERLAAAI